MGPVFERDPLDEWLTLASACNLRTLEAFRGTPEWERVDPVLAMLADGAASLSAVEVVRAADAGHRLNLALVDLFHSNRVLVTPTTASLAPPRSLKGAGMVNGSQEVNWVRYTYPFNLTRSPAASVCTGLSSSGIPVGLQLVGPQHGDLVVLRTAAALEEAIGFEALLRSEPGRHCVLRPGRALRPPEVGVAAPGYDDSPATGSARWRERALSSVG